MDEAEAAKLLETGSSHERLTAARYFQSVILPHRREFLGHRLTQESDVWTRRALIRAIESIDAGTGSASAEEVDVGEPEDDEVFLQALGRATYEIIHELRPILGILRVTAAREVRKYEDSRTRVQLDRLAAALRALDELNKASALVSLEPIDLSAVMRGLLAEFEDQPVEQAAPPSVPVVGNAALIEMAVRNGIRNALEAQAAGGIAEPVVVSWNRSDREAWVTVLDRGPGLPDRRAHIFRRGSSTKAGHLGFGLALARRSAMSLRGTVTVRNRQGGGAAFELRWPTVPSGDEFAEEPTAEAAE